MTLACVGLSHHASPVSVRERLAFGREETHQFLRGLDRDAALAAGIAEVVLVSTCNRTELYLAPANPGTCWTMVPGFAVDLLLRIGNDESVRPRLYDRVGSPAVAHLCRVASGLDSMVPGEYEVLGQVMSAYAMAADAGTAGLMLDAAFRTAIRAGRRARAETGIGRSSTSVASEAVRLAETNVDPQDKPAVIVLGSGQMARLLAGILARRGFEDIAILGRTAGRAAALARTVGGITVPWHRLTAAVASADVVFGSTAAPHAVLTKELVTDALVQRRPGRELYVFDLAVPRDVEASVRELPGVTVCDLDDLQSRVRQNLRLREAERPAVEAIIAEEVSHFETWRNSVELKPVLAAMHARGEAIRQEELERFLRRNPLADPMIREAIEQLSRSIVARLLHGPSTRLRMETDSSASRDYVMALQALFGLSGADDRRSA